MTAPVSASGGPMSDERIAEIEARIEYASSQEITRRVRLDRCFRHYAADARDLLDELSRIRAVLNQYEEALSGSVAPTEEKCGWETGYHDCEIAGCAFPHEQCKKVADEQPRGVSL